MDVATLLIAAVAAITGIVSLTKKVRRGLLTDQLLKDLQHHLSSIQCSQVASRGKGFDIYSFQVKVHELDALAERVEQEVDRIEIQ